jgi:hypothetical protein
MLVKLKLRYLMKQCDAMADLASDAAELLGGIFFTTD